MKNLIRKQLIRTKHELDQFVEWLDQTDIPTTGFLVHVFQNEKPRSLNQNALFWKWMTYLVEQGIAEDATQQDWHDYFVHHILGWTDETRIGTTVLPPRLKRTSDLRKAEMAEFMTAVEAMCAERKVYLPIPGDSDYAKYREAG